MRLTSLFVAVITLVALAPAAEAAPKVAIVDMGQCMQAHAETKKLEEQFAAKQKQAEKNYKEAQKRLEELRLQLEAMNKEDPRRALKARQLELQAATAKFNYEWDGRDAQQEFVRGLTSIYNAIVAQVKDYARQNGIEIVLSRTGKERIEAADLQDFGLQTRMHIVLFAEDKNDITDAIKAILAKK
jgi:Skp family chaperone for outer membrane proteins